MPFRRVRAWRERPPLRDAWYGIGEGGMCTPMPPSPAGSLPASNPSRKGFEPMKPAMLAVIGTALGASAGHALRAPFPGTGGNPVLDLIAYHDPGLHATIRVSYYAAPAIAVVLAGSLCLSVWRVWLQPRARRRGRGRLPAWPTSPNDAAPSLVVGELHHPTVPCESERPSWLVIPETGRYTGVLVVGAVGSGKTTACMYPFAQQLLSWQADRPGSASFSVPGSAVIAHELGHNLSLYHAPCGPAGDLDPSYPYADGSTGAWGYDFREDGSLMPPHHKDLMSYCGPTWISDYHFTNALGYRLFDEGPPSAAAVAAASLLLWGGSAPRVSHSWNPPSCWTPRPRCPIPPASIGSPDGPPAAANSFLSASPCPRWLTETGVPPSPSYSRPGPGGPAHSRASRSRGLVAPSRWTARATFRWRSCPTRGPDR